MTAPFLPLPACDRTIDITASLPDDIRRTKLALETQCEGRSAERAAERPGAFA